MQVCALFFLAALYAVFAGALTCYEGTRNEADGAFNTSLVNCTNQSARYDLCLKCYLPAGVRRNFSGNTYTCGNDATLQFSSLVGAKDCVGCSTDACNTGSADADGAFQHLAAALILCLSSSLFMCE